jgi:hypothetical protein
MIKQYGVQGAAWSWVIRACLDACLVAAWFSFTHNPLTKINKLSGKCGNE